MRRKILYETTQAMQAKIDQLNQMIIGLSSSGPTYSSINPIIQNNADYVRLLEAKDMSQAVSCFKTYIPDLKLPENRLEALWYDYGSLCFTNIEGVPIVSTYAKVGKLNRLGDLSEIEPIDFAGNSYNKHCQVVYNHNLCSNPAVIINDYTGTYREDAIIPRRALARCSISDQALVYAKMRNAIKLTALKAVALIDDEGQREAVESKILEYFNNDSPVATIVSKTVNEVFKIHNLDTKLDITPYLSSIETFEKLRANFNGICTKSPVEKKERMITAEAESQSVLTKIYLYDRYINRHIGLELCVAHRIFSSYTCEINPLLNTDDESKKDNGDNKDKEGNKDE